MFSDATLPSILYSPERCVFGQFTLFMKQFSNISFPPFPLIYNIWWIFILYCQTPYRDRHWFFIGGGYLGVNRKRIINFDGIPWDLFARVAPRPPWGVSNRVQFLFYPYFSSLSFRLPLLTILLMCLSLLLSHFVHYEPLKHFRNNIFTLSLFDVNYITFFLIWFMESLIKGGAIRQSNSFVNDSYLFRVFPSFSF